MVFDQYLPPQLLLRLTLLILILTLKLAVYYNSESLPSALGICTYELGLYALDVLHSFGYSFIDVIRHDLPIVTSGKTNTLGVKQTKKILISIKRRIKQCASQLHAKTTL